MKNKKIGGGFETGIIVFAAALVIALPLRTVQYFTVIEGGSGFFTEKNIGLWIFVAVALAGMLLPVIIGLINNKKLTLSREAEKRPGCGILAALLSLGTFADALQCFNHVFELGPDFLPVHAYPDALPSGEAIVRADSIIIAEGVFALISAVYFLLSALSFLSGKSSAEQYKIIALAPVVWSITRIIFKFTITISYLRVSQLTLEMLMIIFFILFFMSYAQINSDVRAKGSEWKVFAYGLPAAFLGLLVFVPQFIVLVMGKTELLYSYSCPEYCDITASLFILATVLTRTAVKAGEKAPAEDAK